jgi:hypothetical protein
MRLATDQFLQPLSEDPVMFSNSETGWQEVSRGLKLVLQGYVVLIAGAILGSYLLWLATNDSSFAAKGKGREGHLMLGVSVLGLAGMLGTMMVLAGQWRCLMHAPQRQNVKELMLLSLNCVLVESLLVLAGVFLGGSQAYALLQQGPEGLAKFEVFSVGHLLVLGSAVLGLLGAVFFAQFLRNVATCFDDRSLIRQVDVNISILGLLAGGSVGLVLCAQGLDWLPLLLFWTGVAWLGCFAWQIWVFARTSRCIDAGLRKLSREREAPRPSTSMGAVGVRSLSGLRRLIKVVSP